MHTRKPHTPGKTPVAITPHTHTQDYLGGEKKCPSCGSAVKASDTGCSQTTCYTSNHPGGETSGRRKLLASCYSTLHLLSSHSYLGTCHFSARRLVQLLLALR